MSVMQNKRTFYQKSPTYLPSHQNQISNEGEFESCRAELVLTVTAAGFEEGTSVTIVFMLTKAESDVTVEAGPLFFSTALANNSVIPDGSSGSDLPRPSQDCRPLCA